jgi:dihydroxyacetone kinase
VTSLWNEPTDFADEMIEGFVAANRSYVRQAAGGVVRREPAPAGQVAIVIGGGSGHYPAFGGLVGAGLAHGAAMGNLFASPSSQQVYSIAKAVHRDAGILLCYGNYAGDVLNFSAAQDLLRAEGIACETVTVTDDVSSAPAAEIGQRRGVAGDLAVFRAASAAAEAGYALPDVARIAESANARTRSFGVAFTGCTLPGAEQPLFTVTPGRMAVGLGIHGEPGLGETDIPTADSLAELLVGRLLDEVPEMASSTVIPLLNGLGSLKNEEMFVVYRRIARLLEDAGLSIADPHVGEYCTSFDMSGVSLTLFWPDAELAGLWDITVDAPGYRRIPRRGGMTHAADRAEANAEDEAVPPADTASRAAAALVGEALAVVAATIDSNVDELGRLDSVAGDGDHGIGMQRGARAALAGADQAIRAGAGVGTTLQRAAASWADRAGGTSGALWGVMLNSLGSVIGDEGAPTPAQLAEGVSAAVSGVTAYGKAEVGDKTLVDALVPFEGALADAISAEASLRDACDTAALAATQAAAATADLLPRKGRARPHAEKSLGTPDPGAQSFALIVTALAHRLKERTSVP